MIEKPSGISGENCPDNDTLRAEGGRPPALQQGVREATWGQLQEASSPSLATPHSLRPEAELTLQAVPTSPPRTLLVSGLKIPAQRNPPQTQTLGIFQNVGCVLLLLCLGIEVMRRREGRSGLCLVS